jgi:hypothetical protein
MRPKRTAVRAPEIDEKMVGLPNGLCREFVTQLNRQVRASSGDPNDILALVTHVIVSSIRSGFRPEDHERLLASLFAETKRHIAK